MSNEVRARFDAAARTWDDNPMRAQLAHAVAEAIRAAVPLDRQMRVMDYGCGTGLVALLLQPSVGSILAVDASAQMLRVLEEKLASAGITNVSTRQLDLTVEAPPEERFDLIVSSMALHHVKSPELLLKRLADLLRSGGHLCIADLDAEPGDFHSDMTGVEHRGFSAGRMQELFRHAGLEDVATTRAHTIERPGPDGTTRAYDVLLTVGRRG